MSGFRVPFAKQELLHHLLQVGGTAVCELVRGEQTIQASFKVELTDAQALINAEMGGHTGQLTVRRTAHANHLRLRDFLEDIANGRLESAQGPRPAEAPTKPVVLSSNDESTLRYIARHAGTRDLDCGAVVSVHPAVESTDPVHALVSFKGHTQHLTAPTSGELYVSMAVLIERQLAA